MSTRRAVVVDPIRLRATGEESPEYERSECFAPVEPQTNTKYGEPGA
ncbi:MAG: hypothetical protein HYZ50_11555 [Deltaproteobacteria bacterium]|nr:hypothetical protein [Deltaproteobacteria bacterium]